MISGPWHIHVCETPHSYCDVTHSCEWHDSSICVTALNDACDMAHSCVTWLLHKWFDSFIDRSLSVQIFANTTRGVWHDNDAYDMARCKCVNGSERERERESARARESEQERERVKVVLYILSKRKRARARQRKQERERLRGVEVVLYILRESTIARERESGRESARTRARKQERERERPCVCEILTESGRSCFVSVKRGWYRVA